jgi:Cohesin domain
MKRQHVMTGLGCIIGCLSAVVSAAPPHFEGFESPGFVSGAFPALTSQNWNNYTSSLTRVTSGTNGIASKTGVAHGKVDSTVLAAPPDDFSGVFSRLGGYSSSFNGGFQSSLDVYIDLSLPTVAGNTYGWDLSTAVSNQAGAHRRDFIFHAAADASDAVATVLIAASNNSGFAVRQDLDTLNHYEITSSGWYTFEWNFLNVGGVLAVHMILRDAAGTFLWQEIRSDPSDLIATVVGGNRYMWFTFIESDSLHIDNTSLGAGAKLTLVADDACYGAAEDTITVTIEMTDAITNVVGLQCFLAYDDSVLQLDDVSPGGGVFSQTVYECSPDETFPLAAACTPTSGLIDFAVGVDPFANPLGTSADSALVELTFTVLADACNVADLVSFRAGPPVTQLSDPLGTAILPQLVDLAAVTIDSVAPTFTLACPLPDITVNADAGTCEAAGTTVNPAVQTATDTCDAMPAVSFVRSDGKPLLSDAYEAADSPITIAWTTTDDCGNSAFCAQTVVVNGVNDLIVDVRLEGAFTGTWTRCVRFEFYDEPFGTPVIVDEELTFINGLAAAANLEVPCGFYDCLTARDPLHTLRRTDSDDFAIVGLNYDADFTGGDALIGGNLNGDFYIDILDFGVFVSEYGSAYGTPSTTCGTPYPHADISGDVAGAVDVADFSFISLNFLKTHDANCSGLAGVSAPAPAGSWQQAPQVAAALQADGPVMRISVRALREEGMADLIVADVNHDGWLDGKDMAAFLSSSQSRH